MKRALVAFAIIFVGCAGVLAQVATDTADAKAQLACAAEAGSFAQGEACLCAVRAQYPAGPQCDAGADGAR